MDRKKVLILGVASVQMDAIIELNNLGYETFACAMANDGPGAKEAHHFSEINILDEDALIEYIEKNNISVIYSVGSDLAMPIVTSISQKLKLPHFVSNETAKICNNKNLMRQTLGNDFIGNVRHQIVEHKKTVIELDYPFIMKPTDSQGQRGIYLINNYDEYLKYYESAKSYSRSGLVILEDYITGPELSVNGYAINGEICYLVASDRETWPEYTGLIKKHIVPSEQLKLESEKELFHIIENACKKLNILDGPFYVQMKLEKNSPYIIEITPRLDGCHMWNLLQKYSGVNLLKLTFEHLLEQKTNELEQKQIINDQYILEFICQKPNTKATYKKYTKEIKQSLENFMYYNENDLIRPVNGQHDKIGYFIYKK